MFHDNFDDHYSSHTIGSNMNETATGITFTPGTTRDIYTQGSPFVGFTAIAAMGGSNFRCVFRMAAIHAVDLTGKLVYCDSADDGVTWTAPADIVDTPGIDDRDPTFFLVDGVYNLCWHEHTIPSRQGFTSPMFGTARNICQLEMTDKYAARATARPQGYDNGRKFCLYGGPQDNTTNWMIGNVNLDTRVRQWLFTDALFLYEPAIIRTSASHLFIIMRTSPLATPTTNDSMVYIESNDNGVTWGQFRRFSFSADAPNLLEHSNGWIIAAVKENDGVTRHTSLLATNDAGATWTGLTRIYTHATSDSSYPALAEKSDGDLLVTHYEPRFIRVTEVAVS